LVNRKNAEKDDSKVTLAQNEGTNYICEVQGVHQILVLLNARNHPFSADQGSSDRQIHCKNEEDYNGYESNSLPAPPSE